MTVTERDDPAWSDAFALQRAQDEFGPDASGFAEATEVVL